MSGALAALAVSPFARRSDLPQLESCAGTHAAGVTTHVTDRFLFGAVHSGGIEIQVGGQRCEVLPGSTLVVPCGAAARSRHLGPTTVSVLFVEREEVEAWQRAGGVAPGFGVVTAPRVGRRVTALAAALRRPEVTTAAVQEALVQLLPALPRAGALAEPPHHEPLAVRRARELLHARFVSGVSLDELASETGLNKHYLHKAFRSQVGMGPHAYAVQLRVSAARRLLAAGASLREACQQSGFYDQSHLSRAFGEALGVTPGVYAAADYASWSSAKLSAGAL